MVFLSVVGSLGRCVRHAVQPCPNRSVGSLAGGFPALRVSLIRVW
jgi:hypothetical protein